MEKSIHMSADELKEILLKNEEDFILLDVRTPEEHKERNLGGLNIPVSVLAENSGSLDLSKKIITYCKSGGRSQKACEILLSLGAKEVYSLDGGITNY